MNTTMTPSDLHVLTRTGHALVTIRNESGLHMVYRLRRRKPWTDRRGNDRPGRGYWMDVRVGHEWYAVGMASDAGKLILTRNSTEDAAHLYGAELVLDGLATGTRVMNRRDRLYTLFIEDRCGRCGRELTDPTSIERGVGPECAKRS